ncbi:MAG TPA: circadian clock KaiB family protein [Deltaproteobacteria bacterium]|nr:circadian clock KaiB family protein [Deltaproteobacteria bacterium]HOS28824.1 circadian clock KaiB family protein [Deltaproteobacteria bacterium]HPV28381.1 circadian clock KaiB family protein [Deltaproteobacteria bacterium]HQM20233.1 circadian clock KaiB family protein [Deltaproteobacteria bacterium]
MAKKKDSEIATEAFEKVLRGGQEQRYVLRLYVTGSTPKSARAIRNLRRICEEHLKGKYELEVVDIYQQPELAQEADIIATPTLVKKLPPPLRKFIGDLSDADQVIKGMNITPKS